jgi:ATPase subunit of ABC transporter with duplicated ATPase domains
MITTTHLAKSYGTQTLFEGVSLQLNAGNRYGLVGANGSGKTTFLRILSGDETPSEGTVAIPKRVQVGTLRQDQFRYESTPILDVVMMGHSELWSAMDEKDELLARADDEFDAERYAALEDTILRYDGYAFEARAGEILEGLGIPTERHRQPLSTLSGGFKLRVLLAQTLASDPGVLLLDEPTNHLDILSIRWLEKFLLTYSGCAVVISHDHRFLDNVCSHILDVDYQTISLYTGNYTAFTAAKRLERERKEAEIAKRTQQIADHQAFIDRFKAKATKARQAKSKLKKMERITIEELPHSSRRYPTFRFRQIRPSGKQALAIHGVGKSYGANTVLRDVSLNVQRGDQMAIIGPNGIGKSTLLKILIGSERADSGWVEWGHETYPGYFAQDHRELLNGADGTVESWLWDACPGESVGTVRNRLGQVLFSGDEVDKRLPSLSGGEAARLVLARLIADRPNVLILDEPTNHLDLEAIAALVRGLRDYDGTLVFVSHDRWFVSQLANRVVEITSAGINDFPGTFEEYVERCGDDHLDIEVATLKARSARRKESPKRRERSASSGTDRAVERRVNQLRKQRDDVTSRIEEAEARIDEINELFCNPGFFDRTPEAETTALEAEQRSLKATVEELLEAWEAVEEELADLAEP